MAWTYQRDTIPELASLRGDPTALKKHERRGKVLHGLRGSACERLKRLGANTLQISDMTGMSEDMVKRYCRFAVQKDNAMAAVHFLDGAAVTKRDRNMG